MITRRDFWLNSRTRTLHDTPDCVQPDDAVHLVLVYAGSEVRRITMCRRCFPGRTRRPTPAGRVWH